nr:hypothetical protein [Candidatus Sigynarchaeum springense]
MKGIGLIAVLFAHWSIWWSDNTWISGSTFILLFVRVVGIPNFVLMSIIGLLLSLDGKEKTLGAREQFVRMLKRSLIFIAIGAINNLIYAWEALQAPLVSIAWKILFVLFSCNVLTFIGIAQIALFFFKQIHVAFQLAIIGGIILANYAFLPVILPIVPPDTILTAELLISRPETIVYAFFFMENTMAPLVPSLVWPFLACVVYRGFASALATKASTRERVLNELRMVQIVSAVMIALGIVLGFNLTTGIFSHTRYNELVLNDATRLWFAPGYPLFLHLTHPSYVLFSFGALSFMFTIAFELVDLNSVQGHVSNTLSLFGKYSLTVYLLNPIAAFFPFPINIWGFLILFPIATALTIAGTIAWEKRWAGKYSLEWLVRIVVNTHVRVSLASLMALAFSKAKRRIDPHA